MVADKIARITKQSHDRKQMTYSALIKKRYDKNGIEFTYADRLCMSDEDLSKFMACGDVAVLMDDIYVRGQNCGFDKFCLRCASRRAHNTTKDIMKSLPDSYIGKMQWYMLTFTIQHNNYSLLEMLLNLLILSKKKLNEDIKDARKNESSKRFFSQFDGMVYSFEITKGTNGFHPHFHVLACSKREIGCYICAGKGGDIVSNRHGIKERNEVIHESLLYMIRKAKGKEFQSLKACIEHYLGYTISDDELSRELVPYFSDSNKGLHIKKLSTKRIRRNPYSRHSLGEVFKYFAKLSDMNIDDILEFAAVTKEKDVQLLTKTGIFRGKEKNKLRAQKVYEDYKNGKDFSVRKKGNIIKKRVQGKTKFETTWSRGDSKK